MFIEGIESTAQLVVTGRSLKAVYGASVSWFQQGENKLQVVIWRVLECPRFPLKVEPFITSCSTNGLGVRRSIAGATPRRTPRRTFVVVDFTVPIRSDSVGSGSTTDRFSSITCCTRENAGLILEM